jgi:branched-chain amino acid transport system substrate-binding protein
MIRKALAEPALLSVSMSSGIAVASTENILLGAHMPVTGSLARAGRALNERMAVAVNVFTETSRRSKSSLRLSTTKVRPQRWFQQSKSLPETAW